MNNEVLLLNKKHTYTLFDQTKTRRRETLEYKTDKQMETFSFSPPLNLIEEGKWLLAITSLETTNFVFNISDENKSFSISTPGYWFPEEVQKLITNYKNW